MIGNTRKESMKEREQEIEWLEEQIELRQHQLLNIEKELNNRKAGKSGTLSYVTEKVLDIYEKSNIQLSSDIIEELTYMRLTDEKEIFDYIENQRYYWKLENTKKPYKKVK